MHFAVESAASAPTLQVLREQVAALESHVQDLRLENDDLRAICQALGVRYEERLAARRHRRYFARLRGEDRCLSGGEAACAVADVLSVYPIAYRVVEFAGSIMHLVFQRHDVEVGHPK